MKHLPTIAGLLLGLAFLAIGLMFIFELGPSSPKPPPGSPVALFMGALVPTGYLLFVKVLEIVGGILVAIPFTRKLGLLILGPIIINILAFQVFLNESRGLFSLKLIAICLLAAYLLVVERKSFGKLLPCLCELKKQDQKP